MANEDIDNIYVKIKADVSDLQKEIAQLKSKMQREGKDLEKSLSFKAKFDTAIVKLRLSELQKLREKLQKEFDKKVSMNVDASSLDRTRQKLASVDSQLGGVGKSAESMGSKLITGFAALGGMRAIFSLVTGSIKSFYESQKAIAGVEQAVKRTGGVAGFTALQLSNMAAELQKLTGIDDDQILSGVTKQLLTFTQITGTSFKRAQEAVLDLNAVIADGELGGLTSQSIQLGKALEDPIRGVGALSRAGVTFTAEQKNMIAGFVRQNDLMSAQNIILTEIENKYGGQAKALAEASGE